MLIGHREEFLKLTFGVLAFRQPFVSPSIALRQPFVSPLSVLRQPFVSPSSALP